ncbi:MAG TPA: hypothetical protein VG897_13150 [Terriglobales bacterium]|nr:hypothetical protein [Terriglobales bacterium]
MRKLLRSPISSLSLLLLTSSFTFSQSSKVLTGQAAFTGYQSQRPGTQRKITVADLPKPYATQSVDNGPDVVPRPANAWPQTLPGFKVQLYAADFKNPRLIRAAPNGDIFLAESSAGEIKILRGVDANGKAKQVEVFATGLRQPFGIAFYPPGPNPQWVYIGDTDAVVRFPYQNGDLKARGAMQHIADLPGGGHLRGGGHWTRDVAFSQDGKKMWVSVGSHSNADDADDNPSEKNRANVLEFNPDGSGMRIYASGIRNAVGITVNPKTLTGFVTQDGKVWGRPVGIAAGNDSALYVSDDGSNSVWRVSYVGGGNAKGKGK